MYDYFLYVEAGILHVINIAKHGSSFSFKLWDDFESKLRDINTIVSFVGYHKGLVHVASTSELRLFSLDDDLEPSGDHRKVREPEWYQSIRLPSKVKFQALLMRRASEQDHFYCVIETPDNQLDFNTLVVSSCSEEELSYELRQLRPLVPREVKDDPIVKISTVFRANGLNHTAALRSSG